MENQPYNAPKSELINKQNSYVPGHAWKIFFLIWTPLNVWALYDAWMYDRDSEPLVYWLVNVLVYSIFLVGLGGLAFRRRVGTAQFWTAFLPALIIFDLYDFYRGLFPDDEIISFELQIIISAIVTPLLCLGWFAMHCYARYLRLSATESAGL